MARYLLDTGGFDWAQEVPERLFTWFIMAGVVLAAQQGGHVAVEWLPPRLPRAGRQVLLVAGHALVVFAFLMLAWQAMLVAEITAIEHSPVLRLPTSHGYFALAAGCVLLAIATFTIGLRVLLLGPEAMPKPASEELPTS
jgi:TRAP-type C4-dicarboxylate transport system permease small subunit